MNITGNVLQHAQHIEDGVIFSKDNAELSYNTLLSIFETLKGNTPEGTKISTKVDGAPSVACASDFNGKTFIAYKGALESIVQPKVNKKTGEVMPPDYSKICYTLEDCDRVYGAEGEGKAPKMKALMMYAKSIGIPKGEIWQGDFMFSHDDLYEEVIDGEERLCFHPNTIIYTIDKTDPLAKKMYDAKHCVCWHTKYTGSDFGNLHISFDVDADRLPENKDFLSLDANIHNIAGIVTLTEEETDYCKSSLEQIRSELNELENNDVYNTICNTKLFKDNFLLFMNALIKSSSRKQFDYNHIEKFVDWMNKYFDEKISSLTKQKSIDEWNKKKEDFNSYVFNNIDDFTTIINIQKLMVSVKELFEKKLNSIPQKYKNFVKYKSTGLTVPVGQEGFCVSDIDGNLQKIVSRLSFSINNFDPDILKGWESDRRYKQNSSFMKESEDKISTEDAKKALLKTKILDTSENNLILKKNQVNGTRVKNFFTATVQPRATDRETAANQILSDPDKYIDRGIDDIQKSSLLEPHASGSSSTTPLVKLSFDGEDFNSLNDFYINLSFKPNPKEKMTAEACRITECATARAISCVLVGKEIESFSSADSLRDSGINDVQADSWSQSIYTISNSLVHSNYIDKSKKYIVCRENVSYFDGEELSTESKKSAHSVIDDVCFSIYGKNFKKDTWNPSDLYIVNADNYDKTLERIKQFSEVKDINLFNAYLRTELIEKNIIGISLKKLTYPERALFEEINFNKKEEDLDLVSIKLEEPDFIYVPELIPANIASKNEKKSGVSFTCICSGLEEVNSITYYYRRFTESQSMSLELGPNPGNAKIGKTPGYLLDDFKKDNETQVLVGNSFSAYAKNIYNQLIKGNTPIELTQKIMKIEEVFGDRIKSKKTHSVDNIFNYNNWTSFILMIKNMNLSEVGNKSTIKDETMIKLLDWPKIIDFLYALAISESKNTLVDDLGRIYNWSKKIGSRFAPYVLIH